MEREIPLNFLDKDNFTISLNDADFTTSQRAVAAINRALHGSYALSQDGGTINVKLPPSYKDQIVPLLASLENLEITPDSVAKVVLDERNGTVVMGANVRLSTVAIAHGNLHGPHQGKTPHFPAPALLSGADGGGAGQHGHHPGGGKPPHGLA